MSIKRTRLKHEKTLEERLAEEAARFRELAAQLGTQRELYLRRASQAETDSVAHDQLAEVSRFEAACGTPEPKDPD